MKKITTEKYATFYGEQEFQVEYEMNKPFLKYKPEIVFNDLKGIKVRVNFPEPNLLDFSFSHVISCELSIIENNKINVNLLWSQK